MVIEQEGMTVTDPLIRGLVETTVGEPLSIRDVRETTDHLYNLRRFEDVQSFAEAVPGGVRVRYVLVPAHPVDRVEFVGRLGLDEDDLQRILTDRYGRVPEARLAEEAAATLRAAYRDRGYPSARVTPRIEPTHNPDRATMFFDIEAGRRANIAEVRITARSPEEEKTLTDLPRIRQGQPYDRERVDRELRAWVERMQALGYYEARASHGSTFPDDAVLIVNLSRGTRVVVQFAGDPLPDDEQERLVPIRTEGSADEDLLEDASRNIEEYFQSRGYRDATAPFTREATADELIVTFNVRRGPRYVVDTLTISGNAAIPTAELQALLLFRRGDVFVRSTLESRATAIENTYRARGFTQVQVTPVDAVLPSEGPPDRDRRVEVRVNIMEGPRTTVGSVTFEGHMALTEGQLRALALPVVGGAFAEADVVNTSDRITLEYRNRGYESVDVQAQATLDDDSTEADIRFLIREGPQTVIDHIIIIGNDRTGTETILRELRIYEGGPLGYSDLIQSRANLAALGLFRRVEIQPLQHTGESRRDVLIQIEEANPTTLDLGGGIEGGFRSFNEGGRIEERFEFAPRGFFAIGRRNLWGKNRAVTLFTRVSLRSKNVVVSEEGVGLEDQTRENLGFNEYRVTATFAEPRAFSTAADVLITGVVEQAVRTSFNFSRRIARAETGMRLSQTYSLTGRYSFEKTKLFDDSFTERDPLIDRVFPEVRLSRFAGSLIRDTRDETLDPSRGTLFIVDGDLAARFGAARGFEREVDGQTFAELPASERFFAGGDTSVRGFSLDRLGNEATINPETGFPSGGNSVVVVNSELRVTIIPLWQAVGFFDAGNVFLRASALDLTDLRPAAGIGVRYFSQLGPIRFDLGFNLDRRELLPDRPERGVVFHVSFGQAF